MCNPKLMPEIEFLPSAPMPTLAKQALSGGYTSILFPDAILRQVTVTWVMHDFIIIMYLFRVSTKGKNTLPLI